MGGSSSSAGIGKRGDKKGSEKALTVTSTAGKAIVFKKGDTREMISLGGWRKIPVLKVTDKGVTILKDGKETLVKKTHLFNLFNAGGIR